MIASGKKIISIIPTTAGVIATFNKGNRQIPKLIMITVQ